MKSKYTKEILIERVINFVNTNNRYPHTKEFKLSNGLPDYDYFYKKVFEGGMSQILESCGYELSKKEKLLIQSKKSKEISKENTIKIIYDMVNNLNRELMYDDFRNPNFATIGITTIRKYWGTMNKMKKELGLKIIQESMLDKSIDYETAKNQIKNLCELIFLKENRKILLPSDFEIYNMPLVYHSYCQILIRNKDSIRKFINTFGFDILKPGRGYNFVFDDNERVKSIFELKFSQMLKEKGFIFDIDYKRDVRCREFIPNYFGYMDCDYILIKNNKKVYVEIAGLLRDYKKYYYNDIEIKSKSKNKYMKKLKIKEKLLFDNNLEYKIIFPHKYKKDYIYEMKEIIDNMFDF
jgi:hypothetical protein